MGNLLQPIRSTSQIWVVTRHQYGISARISKTLFRGETTGGGGTGGGSVAKCLLYSQARGLHESVKSLLIFSSSARVAKLSHTLLSLFLSKSLQLTSTVLISAYLVNANWPLGRISRGSEPNRNGYEILYCHGNHLSHCYANARHAWATRPCISQLHCNKMIPIMRMLEVVK